MRPFAFYFSYVYEFSESTSEIPSYMSGEMGGELDQLSVSESESPPSDFGTVETRPLQKDSDDATQASASDIP